MRVLLQAPAGTRAKAAGARNFTTCCLSLSFPPFPSRQTSRPLEKVLVNLWRREVLEKPADNSLLSCVTARPMLTPPPALGTGSGLGGGAIGGRGCLLPLKGRLPL